MNHVLTVMLTTASCYVTLLCTLKWIALYAWAFFNRQVQTMLHWSQSTLSVTVSWAVFIYTVWTVETVAHTHTLQKSQLSLYVSTWLKPYGEPSFFALAQVTNLPDIRCSRFRSASKTKGLKHTTQCTVLTIESSVLVVATLQKKRLRNTLGNTTTSS